MKNAEGKAIPLPNTGDFHSSKSHVSLRQAAEIENNKYLSVKFYTKPENG